jgi:hypothetical protein
VSQAYLDTLNAELRRAGISGELRRRIVAEFADHLACDPEADLGAPSAIALQFADELATARARRAAFHAFAALAVAGVLFGAALAAAVALGGVGRLSLSAPATVTLLCAYLAGQIAFVAGGLGLLRGLRFRRDAVISADEAAVLVHRAGVGLVAGVVTMVALPVFALAAPHTFTPA